MRRTHGKVRPTRLPELALALIVVGCAEPTPKNIDELVQQGDVLLDRETMKPYSGSVFKFSPDDTTKIQFAMVVRDGKAHGLRESYFRNGLLDEKGIYKDGEQHGTFESYYENGRLRAKRPYKDGERHGVREFYYQNSQLDEKETYKDGVRHGTFESYYENGQLESKTTYKDGERHGPYYYYYEISRRGQLQKRFQSQKGTYNMGENCGELINVDNYTKSLTSGVVTREMIDTTTYDPCPLGLEEPMQVDYLELPPEEFEGWQRDSIPR